MKARGRFAIVMVVALVALLGAPMAALAQPPMPHAFKGTVDINGELAPDGLEVTAEIEGVEYESGTTDAWGRYGYVGEEFLVPGDDPYTGEKEGGVDGDVITFKVLGVVAATDPPGPIEFESMSRTVVNLSVPITAPVASFSASPREGDAPLTVYFTDKSTGIISSWLWDFGDGETSTAQNPSHTYSAGTYTVKLTVTGLSGTTTATKTDYIHSYGPLSAAFSASPRSGSAPLTVQFTDLSTGEITSRLWEFGDGGTSTETNPSHTYTSAGKYTVSLTVTGPKGTDILERANYITVTEPTPTPTPTATPSPGVSPTPGLTPTPTPTPLITPTPTPPGPLVLLSIEITPQSASIAVGQRQQFSAEATYSDGSTDDITAEATWDTFDTAVATIDDAGLATGVALGTTDVTATLDEITGQATLTITSAPPSAAVAWPLAGGIIGAAVLVATAIVFFALRRPKGGGEAP